jgi:hypothetical protein
VLCVQTGAEAYCGKVEQLKHHVQGLQNTWASVNPLEGGAAVALELEPSLFTKGGKRFL